MYYYTISFPSFICISFASRVEEKADLNQTLQWVTANPKAGFNNP